MIASIYGKIIEKRNNSVLVDLGTGVCYEILIPTFIIDNITQEDMDNKSFKFITYHYLQEESNKSRPILVGFINEIERDFFEQFITVSGIGPRAAIKALNQPISRIAKAIDDMDMSFLCSLPGIGQQRAKEIVAKLQGKVGKFGLVKDSCVQEVDSKDDITKEVLGVLLKLQYKKTEAEDMIKKALSNKKEIATSEELLNQIYKQKKNG